MNVVKLLKRMNEQPEPPCNKCPNFDYCEETEKCCDIFVNYVEFGVTLNIDWYDEDPRIAYLYTCVPKSGISIKEMSRACDLNTTEIQTLFNTCEKHLLAFETPGFYMIKDIEDEIKKNSGRSRRVRAAKIALCKTLLEKDEQVNPERTGDLVREIRRNVQRFTQGVC